MITAYREPDRAKGHEQMSNVIQSVSSGVPAALKEVRRLGRTLKRRAADVLAYFDRPGTSNGPTEAINGRLEHLRGSALGFRNLTNYIARSLLETGGFRPRLHLHSGSAPMGDGSKPPHAALAEDRRRERCGKGARDASGGGEGDDHRLRVESIEMTSEPDYSKKSGRSLAGAHVLARRCPAQRWHEPRLRLS